MREELEFARQIYQGHISFYGQVREETLVAHMYSGIRRQLAQEILSILNQGGDVYTQRNKIKELLEGLQ